MTIKLPDIIDDKDQFNKIKLESETLGSFSWTNGSSPKSSFKSVLSYDPKSNEIILKFESYESLMKADGTHDVQITLLDSQSVFKEYNINVEFFKTLELDFPI
jgi:hypothetical protein